VLSDLTHSLSKLAYSQKYCTNCNRILHIDKDYQILFVVGTNMLSQSKVVNGHLLKTIKLLHLTSGNSALVYLYRRFLTMQSDVRCRLCKSSVASKAAHGLDCLKSMRYVSTTYLSYVAAYLSEI